MAAKKDLKKTVEDGIAAILESKDEPSDGRLKALALGIKMCALNAKLEESEYGDFFNPAEGDIHGAKSGDTVSLSEGKKPQRRKRANGDATLDA